MKVTPRASRARVEPGEPLRVYVTSPPVDGEANRAVLALLAKTFDVPVSSLAIVRGESARVKTVRCGVLDQATLQERLDL